MPEDLLTPGLGPFLNALRARDNGEAILAQSTIDALALDAIAGALSGQEWDADTTQLIADCVRLSGRQIEDTDPDSPPFED